MPKNKTQPHTPGFFPNSTQVTKQLHALRKKHVVNVGGNGDCGFRALAAALVDNIITNNRVVHTQPNQALSRANQTLCAKLLQHHLILFPHYHDMIGEGLWTPVERLERMRHKQGFIPDLAFTLRQMAVNEMATYPEYYGIAEIVNPEASSDRLVAQDQTTSPLAMRQLGTWIDEGAIAAIAAVFEVPITVRVTEANKELFKPLHYGPNPKTSAILQANNIEIRLEDKHYQPMLADSDAFKKVIHETAFMQQKPIPHEFKDPSLDDILLRVKAADERMLEEFSTHQAQLKMLFENGQLDKEKLLAIYIQGLNKPGNSGYLEGRVRQVGLEYGNQDFFERAIKNAGSTQSLKRSNPDDEFDCMIVDELIHAISRAIVIHDLSPDEVYAQIEAEKTSTSHNKM